MSLGTKNISTHPYSGDNHRLSRHSSISYHHRLGSGGRGEGGGGRGEVNMNELTRPPRLLTNNDPCSCTLPLPLPLPRPLPLAGRLTPVVS